MDSLSASRARQQDPQETPCRICWENWKGGAVHWGSWACIAGAEGYACTGGPGPNWIYRLDTGNSRIPGSGRQTYNWWQGSSCLWCFPVESPWICLSTPKYLHPICGKRTKKKKKKVEGRRRRGGRLVASRNLQAFPVGGLAAPLTVWGACSVEIKYCRHMYFI